MYGFYGSFMSDACDYYLCCGDNSNKHSDIKTQLAKNELQPCKEIVHNIMATNWFHGDELDN